MKQPASGNDNGASKGFSIDYARLRFTLVARERAELPVFLGSTLRGAMGHAFRELFCMNRGAACADCMLRDRCTYSYLFETRRLESVPGSAPAGEHLPRPYIIEVPMQSQGCYSKGEPLTFDLILIGDGLSFAPFFILAFEKAAAEGLGVIRAHYALHKVEQVLESDNIAIWGGGNQLLAPVQPLCTRNNPHPDDAGRECLVIRLATPLLLVDQGRKQDEIPFRLLMRGIFRRLDQLGRIHGTGGLDLPFRVLLERAGEVESAPGKRAAHWQDLMRYSNRQQTKISLGGLCGQLSYRGSVSEFLPYLRMAEILHVGKSTVIGLGKIFMETDCSAAPD